MKEIPQRQAKAWFVEMSGVQAEGITFATSRGGARWNMVRAYWEMCGKTREFPTVRTARMPHLDNYPRYRDGGVYSQDVFR